MSYSANKRIAKNTLALYLRMILTLAIGLYTSRVILQILGVNDYGIYNIVGGIVTSFSFISSALRNAVQRYLSFEIGKGLQNKFQEILDMSIQCHVLIIVILIILAETIGLWFVKTQLIIPSGRELAAISVYQFSVISFIVGVFQVPYNAVIISYEKMSFFAYVSILESILKLLMVYALSTVYMDKLILYSILYAAVTMLVTVIYIIYCRNIIGIRRFSINKNKEQFKQLISFSGWSMLNGSSVVLSNQGGNIFINWFGGVAANAAAGIANQVSGVINMFIYNFQSAFQPQIVKQYAAGETDSLLKLIYRTSSFSYYLLLVISLPFMLETDFILNLWLKEVPDYTSTFCRVLIIFFLIDAIQAPLWMLIYGTGKIKLYTVYTSVLTFLNLPISWVLLKQGYPVYWVFIIKVALNLVGSLIRIFYINFITEFPRREYFKNVVLKTLIVTCVAVGLSVVVKLQPYIVVPPIITVILSIIITGNSAFLFGLNKIDRDRIIDSMKTCYIKFIRSSK